MALFLVVLGGCGKGTSLFVDLRTDVRPQVEFVSVDLELRRADGSGAARSVRVGPFDADLETEAGFRIGEFDNVAPGSWRLRVALLDSADRAILSRQLLSEVTESSRSETILMTRDCGDVSCDEGTCVAGRCVDERCSPDRPEFCPSECNEDADCTPGGSGCVIARCETSICFDVPTDSVCEDPLETCHPVRGCEAPVGIDGGWIDDGGVDSALSLDGGTDAGEDGGRDAEVDAAGPVYNVAFVTSSVHFPHLLGSVAGGDAICAARASEAGLSGTFQAYLSSETTEAVTRLGSARGWILPDGRPFADQASDIQVGALRYPLDTDERARTIPHDDAVDNIMRGEPGNTCDDYTSSTARLSGGKVGMTGLFGVNGGCFVEWRILCLGIDYTEPLIVEPVEGRIAFASPNWSPGGGLSDADLHCQTIATGASLAGTFRALLPTGSASAASRFSSVGLPWVRPDGIALAPSAADVLAGRWTTTLPIAADGSILNGNVWTGGVDPDEVPSEHCEDWESAEESDDGGAGNTPRVFGAFDSSRLPCDWGLRLYCLEE